MNKLALNSLDKCRLCLESADKLDELNHHLTCIISACFSIKINMSSSLTNKVCQACVEQLENVSIFRKKIIRNEIILLKKMRENANQQLTKLHSSNLLKGFCINEDNGDILRCDIENSVDGNDIVNDEYHANDSSMIVDEEINIEMEKQTKYTTLQSENNIIVQKDEEQSSESKIDNMFQDFKTRNKDVNTTDSRVKNIDHSIDNQHDVKLNNPELIKNEKAKILMICQNNLEQDGETLSILDVVKLESDNQDSNMIETDKENTDINNFNADDYSPNKNNVNFNDQGNADVLLQDKIYTTDKKFMCLTCLKVFASQKDLSVHYKTIELSKVLKETKKCKEPNIIKVVKNDGSNAIFKCGVCSKVFENKTSIIKHTQVHKVERPFICNLCSRTYKTVEDILRHGVVHSGNRFVCSYECGYTTVHLGALREHVKRHRKEFKYKCDKCGKCFQVKTWYDQHQNVHDKVKPFVCKICGQAFSMARYLTAHCANVHPQTSKVKRYKCVQCTLPCDSRKSLLQHMKQKHGLKTDFLCDVCGQILPSQQRLALHKNVHEATRKYTCGFCKKTFNKKDHKTVHEKIHTGERLNCNNCPKSFTQRCSLRRHIKRYHQGDQQLLEQKT